MSMIDTDQRGPTNGALGEKGDLVVETLFPGKFLGSFSWGIPARGFLIRVWTFELRLFSVWRRVADSPVPDMLRDVDYPTRRPEIETAEAKRRRVVEGGTPMA
jgi:hypothetical protein